MNDVSILVDVLGPVMRGPSSSHTAGSYHLGALARSLLGSPAREARFAFDPKGSYGKVYRQQGSDRAFVSGLLGWPITDDRFIRALELSPSSGLDARFSIEPLEEADHPNTVRIELVGEGGDRLEIVGRSIGGGAVEITRLDGWPVRIDGNSHVVVVETRRAVVEAATGTVDPTALVGPVKKIERGDRVLLVFRGKRAFTPEAIAKVQKLDGVAWVRMGLPLSFVKGGKPLVRSAADLLTLAKHHDLSCGATALLHESSLLEIVSERISEEMARRLDVMAASVHGGLDPDAPRMQLLRPTASKVYAHASERPGYAGAMHARAAARSMAVMHQNGAMGVVCAAPTAGSAGVLPAVAVTLLEELGVDRVAVVRALLAAGAIGVIVAERATFAAEVAGCQVEIGAAGAMAAAAVVEAWGGSATQACDAAAIAFQNTMGSVCDLVQGVVEIPCHTRNAVAASSAFVCADLVLGGYENPIPLDETIDAVYAVGRMMPSELRCTSEGGLAVTPSARCLGRGCG